MHAIRDFFLFCSAAHPSILKRTPTEINRFVGIGATIFFTGLFAAFAAGYAVNTVFNNIFVSILIGITWGLMIFNLDRYIVSTIKKKGSFFRDLTNVVPRLLLAVLIAVVIARPLELKIFETEIEAELQLMQQENAMAQEALVDARFEDELASLRAEIDGWNAQIAEKEAVRNTLDKEALMEADGTGGTMQRNAGPIYRLKKADAQKAQEELEALVAQTQPLIDSKLSRIDEITAMRDAELAAMEDVALTGLASRIEALDRLGGKSEAIYWASIFILLLFIAVETAPIFVKMIASRSPYDFVLNKHEHAYHMNHDRYVTQLSNVTRNHMKFDTETGLFRTEAVIEAENELTRQLINERLEHIRKEPAKWKELLKKGRIFEV